VSTAAAPRGLYLVAPRPPGPGLSDFALWLRANGCGERTITDRTKHVADFARHHPSFPVVNPMHVSAWLGRQYLAPWSRATFYGHLRSYFTFAVENDVVDVDPMARMRRPQVPQGTPRPLNAEQVDTVLIAAAGRRNANLGAWLTLALFAGLRAFEIARIRGQDVTQDSIHVVGKGGRGDDVPTHPAVWALAQDRPKVGYWFPTGSKSGHVTSMHVSTMTTGLFTACGIEGSIHRCRHTYATELLRAGTNIRIVQELMRHRSLNSTMIYTGTTEAERVAGISRLVSHLTAEQARFATKRPACGKGHPFTDANTYVTPKGHRECRTCRRDCQARYRRSR
jgi:integrase/recombinase XerD